MEPAEPGAGADNEPDDALVAAPDEAEALRPDDELEALYTCTPNALSAPEAALDPDADAYAALNLEDAEKEILRQVARDEVEARLEDCGAEDVALASLYAECRRYEAIERERVSSILRGLRSQGAALREMMDAHRGAVRGCAGLLRPSVAGARALWPRLSGALRAEIAAFPGAVLRPGAAGTAPLSRWSPWARARSGGRRRAGAAAWGSRASLLRPSSASSSAIC